MAYPYQRSNYGDYYQGDIFGSILGGIKKVAGVVSSVIPGPVGTVARVVAGSRAARTMPAPPPIPIAGGTQIPRGGTVIPTPGVAGFVERAVPGGATGYQVVMKKRRRMNVANPKALRKAIRRQAGFVKLARRALKGTGYTIASRGRARARSVSVHEAGPGSVTVR